MSQDPQRLLSASSDADDLERALLASVRHVAPPRGAHSEVWGGIATQIAAATVASAALGAAASGSAGAATSMTGASLQAAAAGAGKAGALTLSKALVTKLVLGLALGGAAAGAGSAWISSREAPHRLIRSAPLVTTNSPASAGLPAAAADKTDLALSPPEGDAPELPEAHQATASRRAQEAAARDRLGAESQLLAKARAELRSGNPAAAQTTLQRLQARFPKSVLRQEVEVLEIEILSARGKSAASEERARAFIKQHPESPHSTNLRRGLEKP